MEEKNQQNNQQPIIRTEIKRRTAFRFFIGMICQGKPEFRDERFLYSVINSKDTTRVNIIGNIIDKFIGEQKPYCALTIDDGTGTIRIKAFSDSINIIKDFEQGDTINVIGKLAHFNNEIYILPEIVKETSITWLIARKLELEKEFGKDIIKKLNEQEQLQTIQPQEQEIQKGEEKEKQKETNEEIKEEKIETNSNNQNINNSIPISISLKDEILNKIKENEPEGIDIDKIIMALNKPVDEINNIITELLELNEVYEPKPGRLRIL